MKKQRVPHCNNCEYCQESNMMSYSSYYCKYEGYEEYGAISVDKHPLTSPSWCPLREKNKIVGNIVK